MTRTLLDLLGDLTPPPVASDYVPPTPPSLADAPHVFVNFETTGLKWWGLNGRPPDRPIGVGVGWGSALDSKDWKYEYLPFGHRGGNLDEATVYRWAQQELKGKHITNVNTRFDIHTARVWGDRMGGGGLDFEEMGCTVSDVAHQAALLDDHRFRFSLDALLMDFAGGIRVPRLDESRLAEYHAAEAAPRARYQVEAVHQLLDIFHPLLEAEGLQRVRQLEDDVIYVVVEMEKNGALIDVDLLDRWVKASEQELNALYMRLYRETGMRVVPTSNDDMAKLFRHLQLKISLTENGNPSFTNEILKAIDHPVIKMVRRAKKLASLRSKYLLPYAAAVDRSTGILRYGLNQLKSQKDKWDEHDTKGTVSGRFSSSAPADDEGTNIQQVMKAAKQRVEWGYEEEDDSHDDEIYVIRTLHVPEPGADFLTSDAMQIEYRIFASETQSERLIDIYRKEPLASFHKKTHAMMQAKKPDLTYRRAKDVNFSNIYGAGLLKQALMLEFLSKADYQELLEKQNRRDFSYLDHPALKQVKEIKAIYNKEIPEVKPLLERAKKVAEERGYIRTVAGRRARFKKREMVEGVPTYVGKANRSHKALNARIQGSAADVMKAKLVELHRERKRTGFLLRYTVHDEVDGCARGGRETARMVSAILNQQTFPGIRVPILWEIGLGKNWMDAGKDSHQVEQNDIVMACVGEFWAKQGGGLPKRVVIEPTKKDAESEFASSDRTKAVIKGGARRHG